MLCFLQAFSATQNAWTQSVSGTSATLHFVLWSGKEFIAVGDSGVVLTSGDGLAWTKQVSGTSRNLLAATWAGTRALACGDSGGLIYSGNGSTWQKIDVGLPNARIGAVAWSGSQFVAGYGFNSIILSKDGSSWTVGTAPGPIDSTALQFPTTIQSICWSGSNFVLFQNEYNWCSGACYCGGSDRARRVVPVQNFIIQGWHHLDQRRLFPWRKLRFRRRDRHCVRGCRPKVLFCPLQLFVNARSLDFPGWHKLGTPYGSDSNKPGRLRHADRHQPECRHLDGT